MLGLCPRTIPAKTGSVPTSCPVFDALDQARLVLRHRGEAKAIPGALCTYSCSAIKSIRQEEEFSWHCGVPEESRVDSIRRRVRVLINVKYTFSLSQLCGALVAYLPPPGCS